MQALFVIMFLNFNLIFSENWSYNFESGNLNGWNVEGGNVSISNSAYQGNYSVYLEHYAGQQSHNVYPEDLLVHYGEFSFVAKTSGSISDINMWLYQGDEKEGENLWFGLRPNGSDNPGLNISGFGVEESMSPNFNVGEWIVVDVNVQPGYVSMSINGNLMLESYQLQEVPEGRFKIGVAFRGYFDNLSYTPMIDQNENSILGCLDELACNYNEEANEDDNSCDYSCHDNGDYSLNFEKDTDQKVLTPKWFDNNDSFTFIVDVMLEENQNNQSGILCHNALENDVTLQVSDNGIGAAIYRPGQSNLGLHYETLNDGLFHRVISKYDGNSFYLQIDDEIVDSVLNQNYNINWDQGYHSNSIGWRWTSQGQTAINGRIKEVYIFSSYLLQIEIDSLSYDIIPENLEAHYKFNEGNGNILYDHSGNENHGEIFGATWTDNIILGCLDTLACNYNEEANEDDNSCDYSCFDNGDFSLSFDGINDYVESNLLNFNLIEDFSVYFIFKTNSEHYGRIVNKDCNNCSEGEWKVDIQEDGRILFEIEPGGGNPTASLNSISTLNDNTFHEIIATRNNATGQLKLFVDGVLEDSVISQNNIYSITNDYPLQIGAIYSNENISYPYKGFIKNIKIWNTTLNDNEINDIQLENITNHENIIVNYNFSSGYDNILYDHSGNSNHGTIYGATWIDNSVNQCCYELYGDVNCDSILDISDIIIIIDMILELVDFTDYQSDCADINADSITDISDLILLIDTILGF